MLIWHISDLSCSAISQQLFSISTNTEITYVKNTNFFLSTRWERIEGEEEYRDTSLTTALNGGQWSVSRLGRFNPENSPPVPIE